MLSSSSSEPERRNNLTSTIKIATRVLLISTLALAAFCLLTVPIHPVHASSGGSLSLGTVTGNTFMVACGGGQWLSGMTCYSATITGCANVDNINFIYGYLPPSGAPPQGVITYFDGGDGTSAVTAEPLKDMLSYYAGQNYGVVEIAWGTAWEHTTNANIQNAACRPATFLNYVYNNIYLPITTGNNGNPNAGMCAQGFSAGSTAITYSLAYYGALNQLDAVELISGPVLSDIEQGCEVPQIGSIDICDTGCQLGTDKPWKLSPSYVTADANYVKAWTNDNSCQNTYPNSTTTASNQNWLNQSIVDQTPGQGQGAVPTFSYPSTAMSGWLCTPHLGNLGSDCPNPNDYLHCPNNSSPQGQIFYSQVTTGSVPLNIYSVDGCINPEGAPQGTVAALVETINGVPQPLGGQIAIEQDMAGGQYLPARCFHRPH